MPSRSKKKSKSVVKNNMIFPFEYSIPVTESSTCNLLLRTEISLVLSVQFRYTSFISTESKGEYANCLKSFFNWKTINFQANKINLMQNFLLIYAQPTGSMVFYKTPKRDSVTQRKG